MVIGPIRTSTRTKWGKTRSIEAESLYKDRVVSRPRFGFKEEKKKRKRAAGRIWKACRKAAHGIFPPRWPRKKRTLGTTHQTHRQFFFGFFPRRCRKRNPKIPDDMSFFTLCGRAEEIAPKHFSNPGDVVFCGGGGGGKILGNPPTTLSPQATTYELDVWPMLPRAAKFFSRSHRKNLLPCAFGLPPRKRGRSPGIRKFPKETFPKK